MLCSQTREYSSFQAQPLKLKHGKSAKFKRPAGGGNTNLQSSPSKNQGGVHINGELRSIGVQNDSDYYNPNPWARILGRANETVS